MARRARFVVPGSPHHVTHRANRGDSLFHSPSHCRFYLEQLRDCAAEYGVAVWAHCLMRNHVHLIVVPERKDSLALAIGQAHMRYTRWVNYRHGWSGHLWADRFYSMPMDEAHLWAAVKYVEQNPVRARVVGRAEDFRWSSARAHVLGTPDIVLSRALPVGGPAGGEAWRAWLADGLDEVMAERVRRCTKVGHPLGSPDFAARITEGKR